MPTNSTTPAGVQVGQPLDGTGGGPRRQSEPELGVLLAGADELVGVDLDPRGDAGQHLRAPTAPAARRPRDRPRARVGRPPGLDAVDLVEGVDDDAPDPDRQRGGQLLGRLVVAVQDEAVGGHAGGEGHVELAAGGDVEAHALLVGQAGHGHAQERLGGVGHAVAPGRHRLAAGGAQVGLVVDEQRACRGLGRGRARRTRRSTGVRRRRRAAVRGSRVAVDRTGRDGHRSHRLGRVHAEEAEPDGQPDARRLDQPQPGLGQSRVDVVGQDRAVVVEAVEARRPGAVTQVVTLVGARSTAASATTSGSSSRQRSTSSSRGWVSSDRSTSVERAPGTMPRSAALRPTPPMRALAIWT